MPHCSPFRLSYDLMLPLFNYHWISYLSFFFQRYFPTFGCWKWEHLLICWLSPETHADCCFVLQWLTIIITCRSIFLWRPACCSSTAHPRDCRSPPDHDSGTLQTPNISITSDGELTRSLAITLFTTNTNICYAFETDKIICHHAVHTLHHCPHHHGFGGVKIFTCNSAHSLHHYSPPWLYWSCRLPTLLWERRSVYHFSTEPSTYL